MRPLISTAALSALVALAGCLELTRTLPQPDSVELSNGADADIQATAPSAMVRLVHAVTDLGPIDVYIDDAATPLITNVGYTDVSAWVELEDASYTFTFRPAGAAATDPPLFTSKAVALGSGIPTTVVAAGLRGGSYDDVLRLVTVQEDWGTRLAARARVRFVHAGADAPTLTVKGLQSSSRLEPTPVIDRFGSGLPKGVPVGNEGGKRLEVYGEDEDPLTYFTTPPFSEGDQVLLVATGLIGALARESDGFVLIAVGAEGLLGAIRQDPQIFTVHGARDAGALENCDAAGGTEVAKNIDYSEVQSTFISPGEYNFLIYPYPAGCTGTPLNPGGTASGFLEPGERYMLLLTGEVTPEVTGTGAEPGIQVAPFKERFTLDDDELAKIRFIHGASYTSIYVGAVTAGVIEQGSVLTDPIAWRAESAEVAVPEGLYTLGAADGDSELGGSLNPIVTFDVDVPPGIRVWGVVTGDASPDGDGDQGLQVMLVDTTEGEWATALIDIN